MDGAQLRELSREEVQAIAKREGIRANEKTANIIEQLLVKYPDGVAPFEGTVPQKKAPKRRAKAKQGQKKQATKKPRLYVGDSVSQIRELGTNEPSESNHSRQVKAESSGSQDLLPTLLLPPIPEQQDEAGPSRRSSIPPQEESASARRAGLASRPPAAHSPLPPSSPPSPSQTPPPIPRGPIPQALPDLPQPSSPHSLPHIDDNDNAPPANPQQASDRQQGAPVPGSHPQGEARAEGLTDRQFRFINGNSTILANSQIVLKQQLEDIKKLCEEVKRENAKVLQSVLEVQHKREKLQKWYFSRLKGSPGLLEGTQDVTEMEVWATHSPKWGGQGSPNQAQPSGSARDDIRLGDARLMESNGQRDEWVNIARTQALPRTPVRTQARKRVREEVEEREEVREESHRPQVKKTKRSL